MKISLIGSRGIPARYSGVETCVENLATRLVERGHTVTVYCRPHVVDWPSATYRGVKLVKIRTIQNKFLDTFAHTFLCTLHMATVARPDAAIYFIAGNSPFVLLARLAGLRTIMNVDGLDSQRAKWGPRARLYLRVAECVSSWAPHRTVTDSQVVQRLYWQRYKQRSTFIPYGAELPPSPGSDALERFGLKPCAYILMVGRLVPENGVHVLLDAYARVDTATPLVIVGDAPYEDEYVAALHEKASAKVIFTGYQFGAAYHQLLRNARIFVLASEVGGTHPVLTEAMAAGAAIIANDHEPNVEVLGDVGLVYSGKEGAASLARMLRMLLDNDDLASQLRQLARERARVLYSWSAVTDAYEQLCRAVRSPRKHGGAPMPRHAWDTTVIAGDVRVRETVGVAGDVDAS